jgi:hypothetical protein
LTPHISARRDKQYDDIFYRQVSFWIQLFDFALVPIKKIHYIFFVVSPETDPCGAGD